MKKNKTTLLIQIDESIKNKLKDIAEKEDLDASKLVRKLIREYLEKKGK